MTSLYQRFFIVLILLTVFTGRIFISAMPLVKISKEIYKNDANDHSEKSESSEKQNQLEEKDKPSDLLFTGINNFDFGYLHDLDKGQFSDRFNLAHCHVQIPEQPPK